MYIFVLHMKFTLTLQICAVAGLLVVLQVIGLVLSIKLRQTLLML